MKQKICKECKAYFTPFKPLQSVCSALCAINKVNKNKLKIQKEAYKIEKERIKTRSDWIKEVQTACNAYIRARDAERPCISCGKKLEKGFHAGHLRPTTHAPTRFDTDNIHGQCIQCNLYFHGNTERYKENLILLIGLERVNKLFEPHPPAKWTIDELKALKTEFKLKLKALNDNS